MTADLFGSPAGNRADREEYRIIVRPGEFAEWAIPMNAPDIDQARAIASQFVVPTRIEARTVTTFTTKWEATR